jgi:transposase
MSPWLYAGLVEAELPAVCVETRHMHAALSARINKMVCPGRPRPRIT